MRFVAILIAAMLFGAASEAQAEDGLPSQQLLSEMGLSGIQVMTDLEASRVRGSGYSWGGSHSWGGGFYRYRQGIYKFHDWVRKFHDWAKKFHHHAKKIHRRASKKHTTYGGYAHYAKSGKTKAYRPTKRW